MTIIERVRSSPRVGGGQISRRFSLRTGGPGSYARRSSSIRKAHLCELRHVPVVFSFARTQEEQVPHWQIAMALMKHTLTVDSRCMSAHRGKADLAISLS